MYRFILDCPSMACSDQSRVEDAIFITLRFVQTLSDSKVIDRIKNKLFDKQKIFQKLFSKWFNYEDIKRVIS